MGIFSWLFPPKKETVNTQSTPVSEPVSKTTLTIPEYLPVDETEAEVVAAITSSIVAQDNPSSKFKVTKVMQKNPEKEIVASIASAILAGDCPESQFRVKSITRIN